MDQEVSVNIADSETAKLLVISTVNLFDSLMSVTEDFIKATSQSSKVDRDIDIVKKRFGLENGITYCLEDIGAYHGIVRERVRQVEDRVISQLSGLMDGSKESKKFNIQKDLTQEYCQIKDSLLSLDYILAEEDVRIFFKDRYEINEKNIPFSLLNFLMELMGYCSMPTKNNGYRWSVKSAWCLKERYDMNDFKKAFSHINTLLDKSEKFTLFDIVVSLNKAKRHHLDKDLIRMLLALCPEIDRLEEDTYQVKLEFLPSAAEKAYRILHLEGNPLHFRGITKTLNHTELNLGKGKRIKIENLKNQLGADDRFMPIGKSGYWALADWKVATETIIKIMEDSFHESGKPLSLQEVYQYVDGKRPGASLKSVTVYLNHQDIFSRVGRNQYELAAWGAKPIQKIKRRKADEISHLINTTLKKIFLDRDSIVFADLVRVIKEETKMVEVTVRNRLKSHPNLVLKQDSNLKGYMVYCTNKDFDNLDNPGNHRKRTLRDKVQDEILSILQNNPNRAIVKGVIYNQVNKVVECKKQTFYMYLREMKDIKQYLENGKHYCLFEHQEEKGSIDIDMNLLAECSDLKLLDQLKRVIGKLNVDEVDLGLFDLGRIFENELKDYLMAARDHAVIQVNQKDLQRLVNMIDCVVREKVATKGYYLHILREERNERAHGKIPNLEERKKLLNKAHYVADLYIQKIIFFNSKRHEIMA